MREVRGAIVLGAIALWTITGCETLPDGSGSSPPLARGQVGKASSAAPQPSIVPPPEALVAGRAPPTKTTPTIETSETPLPINLATALQLANVRPLEVQITGSLVEASAAALTRAKLLWVPNLDLGTDYFNHLGPQQTSAGSILTSNRNSVMVGLGPNVVFAFSDAIYAPLAARQDLRAREATLQASRNDATLAVTEAYFDVQQARGQLAAATTAVKYAEDVARKTQAALSKGLTPPSEANRANAELGRRKQTVSSAREQWRVASAELSRLLRLDASSLVDPVEPPFLPITVIDPTATIDNLIPIALATRPELSEHQAIVQATLARLKQEKIRPLVPSLAIRSASTSPTGSIGYGLFGGGTNGTFSDFAGRFDLDLQLIWEFQALGFGNRAIVRERRAEYQAATLDLFRTQDRVAAEVVTAFAQARSAAERVNEAEPALREAIELANKTVEELGQTRRIGDTLILLLRPQEAVAAVQAFAQATSDFFTAVADYNRAQFRLYRALGHPSQCLANALPAPPPLNAGPDVKPAPLPQVPMVAPDIKVPAIQQATVPQANPIQQVSGTISVYPRVESAPNATSTAAMPQANPQWSAVAPDSNGPRSTPVSSAGEAPALMPAFVRLPIVVVEHSP